MVIYEALYKLAVKSKRGEVKSQKDKRKIISTERRVPKRARRDKKPSQSYC